MVCGTYNYSYWGESKPTNITVGPHIVPYRKPFSRSNFQGISPENMAKHMVTSTSILGSLMSWNERLFWTLLI